jgi:hypothetical protein
VPELPGRAGPRELWLTAAEVTDLARWRWRLTDAAGTFLAGHEVRLETSCSEFEAFTDLQHYLRWSTTPDAERRAADEGRVIAGLGAWIGEQVFGPVADALADARPATVRVVVPPQARWLAFRPLELAHAGGRPLALQDVTLVMEMSDDATGVAPAGIATAGSTAAGNGKLPVGERLRVLGLFSLPEGGTALNLRRERHSLVRLVKEIEAGGRAADVRVLQYGATRERLRDVLEEAAGWDIIHISGHGAPGELLLETADGGQDRVSAAELCDLLDRAGQRVKLVTVAACWSAALTAAQQRRLLGLPVPGERPVSRDDDDGPATTSPAQAGIAESGPAESRLGYSAATGALAAELASRLSCAVLAMRYPVDDDFAIALTGKVYDLLARQGQPLPRALGIALRDLLGDAGGAGPAAAVPGGGPGAAPGAASSAARNGGRFPALSVAVPALFGGRAVDLRLAAPRRTGPPSLDHAALKMAGFPPAPERFVGRTGVMARASAALAAASGIPGVLLHGMPGGGKTACALELAYGHEQAFDALIWYKAPDEGSEIGGALTDFALTLERAIGGLQMTHLVASADALTRFLPLLTEVMKQYRLLIVIDNVESLVSEGGQWRDDRWGQVIGALTAHAGFGRLILTSRRVPAARGVQSPLVRLPVDALSADEALLLARELPHLRTLIEHGLPGLDRQASRQLALGVLNIAQGHPKLLELADGQAARPDRLAALVTAGDQAWRDKGGVPSGFFTTTGGHPSTAEGGADSTTSTAGGDTASAADYWHVLAAWTTSVADRLTPGERDLFWFLCCLEEGDREWAVLASIWARLWARLGRDSAPPELDAALATLAAATLITARIRSTGPAGNNLGTPGADSSADSDAGSGSEGVTDPGAAGTGAEGAPAAGADGAAADRETAVSGAASVAIHPGVAEAGRARAGQPFRDAVDAMAAAYWHAVHGYASGGNDEGSVHTGLVVRAGLAAVPYYLRHQDWKSAGFLLESAFVRDPSRANAAAVLPAIQQITRHDPRQAGVLARVLQVIDPAAADATLRAALDDAVARGDYRFASVAAGQLASRCTDSGRLAEALQLTEQKADYTRRAGLGPWTQLGDEVRRLQVLAVVGQAGQVLDEVGRLRARMDALPATPAADGPAETAPSWSVRETLLDTGREAARQLRRWEEALELNAAQVASLRGRRAPATDIAFSRFNDYFPLLRLGRTGEALDLLLECRQVFQDAHDTRMLGNTLSALADTENQRGHGDAAIRLERDALRYLYLAGDVTGIAVSYHNLGNYLRRHARQPAPALASHLAATLIRTLAGADGADRSLNAATDDLREFGAAAVPPHDVADLCERLADIPGTDLTRLIAALSPDLQAAEQTLRDLIALAQEQAHQPGE